MFEQETKYEKQFQELIFKTELIKKNIAEILEIEYESSIFEKEVEFINGITSDFIIYDKIDEKMKAIIECKRADIGVTEYVRGVGQLFQYEYFQEENIPPKKYSYIEYSPNFNKNILLIQSSFIRNTNLNIGRFKYPSSSLIAEVNEKNSFVRIISKDELKKIAEADKTDLITICQYYMRDNRIFEYYILLKILMLITLMNSNIIINRKEIESEILKKIKVINNGNWRNAFITLSGLGFINSENKVTLQATPFTTYHIEEFINLIYEDYIHPFIDLLMEVLKKNANGNIVEMKNKEIAEAIRKRYKNKDILFLTDSDSRYISSWLNIMRDDIGCIDFKSRSATKVINFIPEDCSRKKRIELIKKYTKARDYMENYEIKINSIIREVY